MLENVKCYNRHALMCHVCDKTPAAHAPQSFLLNYNLLLGTCFELAISVILYISYYSCIDINQQFVQNKTHVNTLCRMG